MKAINRDGAIILECGDQKMELSAVNWRMAISVIEDALKREDTRKKIIAALRADNECTVRDLLRATRTSKADLMAHLHEMEATGEAIIDERKNNHGSPSLYVRSHP